MHVNHSFIYMIESNKIKDIDNNNIMPFIGIVNCIEGEKDSTSSDDPTDDPVKILPGNLGNNLKVSFGIICFILLILFLYILKK